MLRVRDKSSRASVTVCRHCPSFVARWGLFMASCSPALGSSVSPHLAVVTEHTRAGTQEALPRRRILRETSRMQGRPRAGWRRIGLRAPGGVVERLYQLIVCFCGCGTGAMPACHHRLGRCRRASCLRTGMMPRLAAPARVVLGSHTHRLAFTGAAPFAAWHTKVGRGGGGGWPWRETQATRFPYVLFSNMSAESAGTNLAWYTSS